MSSASEGAPNRTELTEYRERSFRSHGLVDGPNGFRIKLYSIHWHEEPVAPETLARAGVYAARELPAAAEELGDHYGLGFAILHAGKVANWLLLQWWAHADILCLRMAKADGPADFEMVDRPYHGCVWEGIAIQHEHRAWIRTMLTAEPDAGAYLADVLPDGSY